MQHELGYHNCPAYGNRCQFCGRYNHDQRACWFKYPNFCRFQKEKTDRQSLGTEISLKDDTGPAEVQVEAKEQKAIDELKETQYTSEVENAPQSDIDVKVIDELPQEEESVYALDPYKNLKEDTSLENGNTSGNVRIEILTQENVQAETIKQHFTKEGSESSSSKCKDLEEDLEETKNLKEVSSAESFKTNAEIKETQGYPNKILNSENQRGENNDAVDEREKNEIFVEKVWAMQMIEKQESTEWFELPNTKKYYTSHGGALLRNFIEKYKQVKKLEDEKISENPRRGKKFGRKEGKCKDSYKKI